MNIELDARKMTDRTATHDHLQERLELPDYYGRNLDALYDLLTERAQPTHIILRFSAQLEENLGGYAAALLDTLRQVAEINPTLDLHVE